MINVEKILSGEQQLEPAIRRELVERICAELHYEFSAERLERISEETRAHLDVGFGFAGAFSRALDTELLFYGDPHGPSFLGY